MDNATTYTDPATAPRHDLALFEVARTGKLVCQMHMPNHDSCYGITLQVRRVWLRLHPGFTYVRCEDCMNG